MRGKVSFVLMTTALCAAYQYQAFGDQRTWDGGGAGHNWGTAQNWYPDFEPTANDIADINNGDYLEITDWGEECMRFYLGRNAGQSGTGYMYSGYMGVEQMYVGFEGSGVFHHSGGTLDFIGFGRTMGLGEYAGSNGNYYLSGTGEISADAVYVGALGSGVMHQTGGRIDVGTILRLGWSGSGEGTYYHSAGVCKGGLATYIAHLDSTRGVYELSGTGEYSTEQLIVGQRGDGRFIQTGGRCVVLDKIELANWDDSTGIYAISNGRLEAADVYLYGWGQVESAFQITGGDAAVFVDSYTQYGESAELRSYMNWTGISTIYVKGAANLEGRWIVTDDGTTPYGDHYVVQADGGLTEVFTSVTLPGPYWSWGVDGGTLWVRKWTATGDVDFDGDVDLSDLAELLAHYGMTSGASWEDGDLDGDGDVDLADLAALLANYGS